MHTRRSALEKELEDDEYYYDLYRLDPLVKEYASIRDTKGTGTCVNNRSSRQIELTNELVLRSQPFVKYLVARMTSGIKRRNGKYELGVRAFGRYFCAKQALKHLETKDLVQGASLKLIEALPSIYKSGDYHWTTWVRGQVVFSVMRRSSEALLVRADPDLKRNFFDQSRRSQEDSFVMLTRLLESMRLRKNDRPAHEIASATLSSIHRDYVLYEEMYECGKLDRFETIGEDGKPLIDGCDIDIVDEGLEEEDYRAHLFALESQEPTLGLSYEDASFDRRLAQPSLVRELDAALLLCENSEFAERNVRMVWSHYGDNLSMQKIADNEGITGTRAGQIINDEKRMERRMFALLRRRTPAEKEYDINPYL